MEICTEDGTIRIDRSFHDRDRVYLSLGNAWRAVNLTPAQALQLTSTILTEVDAILSLDLCDAHSPLSDRIGCHRERGHDGMHRSGEGLTYYRWNDLDRCPSRNGDVQCAGQAGHKGKHGRYLNGNPPQAVVWVDRCNALSTVRPQMNCQRERGHSGQHEANGWY